LEKKDKKNMIYMCSGKTGSGKSATAVRLTYKFWKKGKNIWSNTPLFFTDYKDGFGGENIVENPEYFNFIEKLSHRIKSKLVKKDFQPKHRGKINI